MQSLLFNKIYCICLLIPAIVNLACVYKHGQVIQYQYIISSSKMVPTVQSSVLSQRQYNSNRQISGLSSLLVATTQNAASVTIPCIPSSMAPSKCGLARISILLPLDVATSMAHARIPIALSNVPPCGGTDRQGSDQQDSTYQSWA